MVYSGKSHLEMDDLGVSPFMETPTWLSVEENHTISLFEAALESAKLSKALM